ncbi:hypothetical protein ILUMI_20317 [Ignelater luminosus]|uniref:RNA-directed DNA polymerase n=1 Tax=Ignelater luminosus TaxID=2038154 RepID=A0A8K0FZ16_IGNLU|nr:hypothetical protein ILUMI_20317 [Ignelater luminosus]
MEVQEIYFTLENTFVAEQPAAGAGATVAEVRVGTYEAVTLLNAHFSPKVNTNYERYIFRQMAQVAGETICHFISKLRQQAELCNFDTTDEQVIKKCSISSELRKKFLQEGTTLKLRKMMKISRLCESVEQQAKHMEGAVGEVNRITTSKVYQQRRCYPCNKVRHYAKDKNCPAKNTTCRKLEGEIQRIKTSLNSNRWLQEDRAYGMIKDELCTKRTILLQGTRIIIPKPLTQLVLKLGHEGHPGMVKIKEILRTKVWWPKMNQAVEKFVQQCLGCQLVSKPDSSEPIYRTPLPKAPWEHICIDYLDPLPTGDHILDVTDYYSRWLETEITRTITAEKTIQILKPIFSRFGLPISIAADNGKAFVATQFLEFCEEHGIYTPYKVVNRRGTQVEVMSPEGVCYKRNTSKLKKYYGNNDDIPVTQASEKTHYEDVKVEHGPIRRESSIFLSKEEGNKEERSLLSTRSPVRSRSHLSRTQQSSKWLLDYDQN